MRKKLVIINGTMGVGKSATCKELYQSLESSVWLDGDWCWMMNPFDANEYNRKMVVDNITYLLRNFINNPYLEFVIFNWVIHTEQIFEIILEELKDLEFEVYKISLVCSEESFIKRVRQDVENGLRDEDSITRGLERFPMYAEMDTIKVDTSNITAAEAAHRIIELIG